MGGAPPIRKDMQGLLQDHQERLDLIERRQARGNSSSGGGPAAQASAGLIAPWSGAAASIPTGWLLCDGRAVSRADYALLYAVVGTTYGAGDGSTTFGLPNLKGRTVFGLDAAQTEFDALGETGGAKSRSMEAEGIFAQITGSVASSQLFMRRLTGKPPWAPDFASSMSTIGTPATDIGGTIVSGTMPTLPPYLVTNWIISVGGTVGTGGGSGGGWTPVSATETVQGIAEIATTAETTAGTDDSTIITPLKLTQRIAAIPGAVDASETVKGVVELATAAETTTGTDNTRAVHPQGLKVELDKKAAITHQHVAANITDFNAAVLAVAPAEVQATETVAGKAEIATQAETTAGTDDARIVTPLKLAQRIGAIPAAAAASETVAGVAEIATTAETNAGTDDLRIVTPLKLKGVADTKAPLSHTHTSSQITDFATAVPAAVPAASETVLGKAEIATQGEVTTGTDDLKIVTPLKLAQKIAAIPSVAAASETVAGVAEIATTAETTAGTDDLRIVTPLKLKGVTDTKAPLSHTHTASQVTDFNAAALAAIPASSETVQGKVELATATETTTGTDNTRAVHPAGLKAVTDTKAPLSHTHTASQVTDFNAAALAAAPAEVQATETVAGKAEIATQAETTTGTDDLRIVTPLKLAQRLGALVIPPAASAASETVAGIVELATAAETTTGTDNTRAVHPQGLKVELDKKALVSHTHTASQVTDFNAAALLAAPAEVQATETVAGKAEIATTAEVTTGTDDLRFVTPLKLTQRIAAIPPGSVADATETTKGVGEIATQAEVTTGTDDTRFVTPLKLAQRLVGVGGAPSPASELVAGIAEIATTAETTAGTDDLRIVTPLKLKGIADTKAPLSHTHTSSQITDFATAVPAAVPASSETVQGKVELATAAETTTGTDITRAVHPAGLKAVADTKAPLSHTHTASQITDFNAAAIAAAPAEVQATETVAGKAEIATQAETTTGTDDARIVTPLKLAQRIAAIPSAAAATETVAGVAEIATTAEVTAGTDDARIVTPLKLAQQISAIPGTPAASETVAGIAEIATTAETTTGTDDLRIVTPLKLKGVADTKAPLSHTHTMSQITDAATAIPAAVPVATETVQGKVELATPAETTTGTDNTRAVHPQGLRVELDKKAALSHTHTSSQITDFATAVPAAVPAATETVQGKVELATAAETTTGTDSTRAVHPQGLKVELDKKALLSHTHTSSQITDFATAVPAAVPAATETVAGKAEIATSAEVAAGTDDARIVTPLKLKAAIASSSSNNLPESETWDFRMDPNLWNGPVGPRLTIPSHVTPAGGEVTHPSILFFPEKWNGYRYWMAYTPYPGSNDDHEDPNLSVSQDGITWQFAPGVVQPLDDADGTPEYNSDTHLALGPDGKMFLFWRFYDSSATGTEERVYMRTSLDGVTWTAKQLVYQWDQTVHRPLSPSFTYEDGKWTVWAVDIVNASTRVMTRMQNTGGDPTTGWGAPVTCTVSQVPAGKQVWHLNVRRIGGQYVTLMCSVNPGGGGVAGVLSLMTSTDGLNWVGGSVSVIPPLQPGVHDGLYRATFIPEVNDGVMALRVWYSAYLPGLPDVWGIYRTLLKINPPTGTGPYAMAAGTAVAANDIGNGAGTTTAVTFPSGRFSLPPVVVATSVPSARLTISVNVGPTATGFSTRLDNWSPAGAGGANGFHWHAVQMSSTSSPGLFDVAVPTTNITATCETAGCSNAGIPIPLIVPLVLDRVVCGVCGQPILDLI